MEILSITAAYLLMHFIFYLIVGRNLAVLKGERAIFLFHFISFVLIAITALLSAIMLQKPDIFITLCAVCALHGIYSLSFLELWSLSQGGYSLTILRSTPIELNYESDLINGLENLGNSKFNDRLQSVQKLGLVAQQGNKVSITRRGAKAAFLLLCISRFTNVKDRG